MFSTKNNPLTNAVILYIIIVMLVIYLKPSFLYTEHNTLKTYGLNFNENSIIPFPMFVVLLSIFVYLLCLKM